MISVIRTKRISDRDIEHGIKDFGSLVAPAGEVFYFNSEVECSECCTFMWGRSIRNYLVFRNGYPVELDTDLYEFERRLEAYK